MDGAAMLPHAIPGLAFAFALFIAALTLEVWTGIVLVSGLLCYEHWLVRPDDLTRVNRAFFHVNAVVSLGLFAVGTLDLLT